MATASVMMNLRNYVFSDLLEEEGWTPPDAMYDLQINVTDQDGEVKYHLLYIHFNMNYLSI